MQKKEEIYGKIIRSSQELFKNVNNNITNLSNASVLLNYNLPNINWVGFYLLTNNELTLGPFQGLPACTNIKMGKGVCGTSALLQKTIIVPNVHEFDGHIACDSNSNSEIVVPIFLNQKFFGVLDIDSPLYNNFDEVDKQYLEEFIQILSHNLK